MKIDEIQYQQRSMYLYGNLWISMKINEFIWKSIGLNENLCISMYFYENLWISMNFHRINEFLWESMNWMENPLTSKRNQCISWIPKTFKWNSMYFHGYQWISIKIYEFISTADEHLWISMEINEFKWTSMYYNVFPISIIENYRDSKKSHWGPSLFHEDVYQIQRTRTWNEF
jgi:hypothetical protein